MSSKYKRKGRPKFVIIWDHMLRCPAWADLTAVDRALYVELKRKFDGTNNGRIGMSCRQAAEVLGIGKGTAARSFLNLQDHGFIAVAKESKFNMKQHHSTEWILTELKNDVTEELAEKTYMRWQPDEKSTVPPQVQTVPPQVHQMAEKEVRHG